MTPAGLQALAVWRDSELEAGRLGVVTAVPSVWAVRSGDGYGDGDGDGYGYG